MAKQKSIKTLAVTSVATMMSLGCKGNAQNKAVQLDWMIGFGQKGVSTVYVGDKAVRRLNHTSRNGITYVSLDTLETLGYSIGRDESVGVVTAVGTNHISIDSMTLKVVKNNSPIAVDMIKVSNEFFVSVAGFGALSDARAEFKANNLYLSEAVDFFIVSTSVGRHTICTYSVKNKKIYVELQTLIMALPTFRVRNGVFSDGYGQTRVNLNQFVNDKGMYSFCDVVEAVGGTYTLAKVDGARVFGISHESTAEMAAGANALEVARSLACSA
ncbi:hypothetical protein AGMMS49975_26470 [Clostridia bacterium]|nr:hypothetical protein AGMMS49975_26470 [Clostridia bacterium]